MSIQSLLIFVHGDVCAKNSRNREVHRLRASCFFVYKDVRAESSRNREERRLRVSSFLYAALCVQSKRSRDVRRSGVPYFLYVVMHVLKVIGAEGYVIREPLSFIDALAQWSCVR
jgi:hypothetical protein